MNEFCSARELAGLPGMPGTESGVIRLAKKADWLFRQRAGRGGGREYATESLPEETRLSLIGQPNQNHSPSDPNLPMAMPKGEAIPIKPCGPAPALCEEQKSKARAKYEMVRLYVAYLAKALHKRKTQARDEFILLYQAGEWQALRELLGEVHWKTIEAWKLTLRETGDPYSLADTRGVSRRGKTGLSIEQMGILRTFAHHPNKLKPAHAVRWARLVMRKRGIDTMSGATYQRYIENLRDKDYPLWIFCREGEQALENKCGYTIKRDWSKIAVGDLLTADGHVMNFQVINPWTGKPCRPVLILWYDCASNMPLGWELMPTENTAAIHTALRRAIIALGKLPRVAYLDNGRAFKGKHFTGASDFDNGAIAGLYARLGIATTFATPYHGQAKTVERFFGTLLEAESILPTYTGNSISNKPARLHRGERMHRQLWEKYGGAQITLSLEQAHEILAAWFDDYALRPQRGHLNGKSPLAVFEQGRGPGVDQEDLHELMMSVEIRSVSKEGVKMFGEFYYHPAIYGRREPVVARFDLRDRSCLYLYEKTGEFICRAEPQIGVHPAARLLGNDDELDIFKQEAATKQRMKSLTVGPARKLLRTVVLPEHQRQLEQIGLLPDGEEKRQLPAPTAKVVHIDAEKLAREVAENARYQAEADERDFRDDLMALESFDRYDRLLELAAKGVELAEEWTGFMAFFEKSDEYLDSPEFWDQRRMAYAIMHRAERVSQ